MLEVDGLSKSFGERAALREVEPRGRPRESCSRCSGRTAPARRRCSRSSPGSPGRTPGRIDRSNGEVGWVPAAGRALPAADGRGEPAAVRPDGGGRRRRGDGRADARPDRASPTAATIRSPRSRAATSSGSTSRSACSAIPPSCCSTSPAPGLDPSQRVRLWEFVAGLAKAGTTVIYSTHQIEEASHYGDRLVVLADGETIFDGSFDELRRAAGPRPEGTAADPENDFVRFLQQAGPLMRWLLLKDLQLLRRSPLVTGAAGRLPDRARRADRPGDLAQSREAAGRLPQPDPDGHRAQPRQRRLQPGRGPQPALRRRSSASPPRAAPRSSRR